MLTLLAKSERVGHRVKFGKDVTIKADTVEIGDDVVIDDQVTINCRGHLRIGHHGMIGRSSRIDCNNLSIGAWFYSCEGLEIGAGGCHSKESNVTIGNNVGIFERVLINPNSPVSIGDNCGIGREVQIWTHGAWLDPLFGFPSDFGPVTIGCNVWLPARCIVLPNIEIGDNCVIGINSVVNKSLPAGSFAAGSPARVLKESVYPATLDATEASKLICRIVSEWRVQIEYKQPRLKYEVECFDTTKIRLTISGEETVFDCREKAVRGASNPYSEDLRDYLRRRGIKILTNDFFRSVEMDRD